MATSQIAIVVGSLRKESFNRKLATALTMLSAPDCTFTQPKIDDLPLYNQDDDANQAPAVKRFKSEIAAATGVIFVTPEYNRSIPGVLKNAIDHASRPPRQSAWAGKPAGIVGASPGAVGTAAAQQHLRNVLVGVSMPTLPQPEVYLQVKDGFFADDGSIAADGTRKFLQGWMDRYLEWVKRHPSA